jgi:hypothetical protein
MHKTIAIVVLSVIAAICWADAWNPTPAAQPSVVQKDTGEPRPACPDPDDSNVSYVSPDPSACAHIRFTCKPGEIPFSNHCGCGCIGNPKSWSEPNQLAVSYVSQDPPARRALGWPCDPRT